jgi:hypothetical protein
MPHSTSGASFEDQRPRAGARVSEARHDDPCASVLPVTNRHRPAWLPQIPLADIARPIHRPLIHPRPNEHRPHLTEVVIENRLAPIEPERLQQLPDPDARKPRIIPQQLVNLVLERLKLRRPLRDAKDRRLVRPQRRPDRVPRQPSPPNQLPDRHATNELLPPKFSPTLHVQHASSWHSITMTEPGSIRPRTPPPNIPTGVKSQPAKEGQFSTGADTRRRRAALWR